MFLHNLCLVYGVIPVGIGVSHVIRIAACRNAIGVSLGVAPLFDDVVTECYARAYVGTGLIYPFHVVGIIIHEAHQTRWGID